MAFNSWRKSDLKAELGDASIILDHFDFLIPDVEQRKHFLDVLAHSVQYSATKINHVLFVIGGQGTGKSWISLLIREIFGAHNVCVIDSSLLSSDFNASMADRQVLILEEVGLEDKSEAYNSRKRWVTDESMLVDEKGIIRYQAEMPKPIVAFSNEEVPL